MDDLSLCNVTRTPPLSSNKAEPTLALKPKGDVTRSPKQGYQWPHKKDSCPPKILKRKVCLRNQVIYQYLIFALSTFYLIQNQSE